jgi:hypothetical protein
MVVHLTKVFATSAIGRCIKGMRKKQPVGLGRPLGAKWFEEAESNAVVSFGEQQIMGVSWS